MADYTELIKALRICNRIDHVGNCNECFYGGHDAPTPKQYVNGCKRSMCEDAAAAIEELQAAWIKSETDATNLTGRLAQAEADVERLNREIDKRIATEIELSNQVDALKSEPLQVGKAGNQYTLNEPKRGKWVSEWDGYEYDVRCSVCGEMALIKEGGSHDHAYSRYCPNCGARMTE